MTHALSFLAQTVTCYISSQYNLLLECLWLCGVVVGIPSSLIISSLGKRGQAALFIVYLLVYALFQYVCVLCNSYTMGFPPVRGDYPRSLASGLSYVHVDKHGITILYHLHQCRPCTSRDSSC